MVSRPAKHSKSSETYKIDAQVLSVIQPFAPVGLGLLISTLVPPVMMNLTSLWSSKLYSSMILKQRSIENNSLSFSKRDLQIPS